MNHLQTTERAEIIPAGATLQQLLETFLLSQDVSHSSRLTYARQLKQFSRWLEGTGRASRLNSLQMADILAYKADLLQEKSPYTVSSYLTVVRKFYQWLEAQRIYPNVASSVKGARKSKGFAKDCLTVEQLREALEAIDTDCLEGLRDYALLNLLARTGLRTVEISRAQVEDLRQQAGQPVLWIQGKGREAKDDFVLLTEEALRPIRRYLAARGKPQGDEPLFCSISNRSQGQSLSTRSIRWVVKEAFRKIGVDDRRLTAHSLRHTAITLAIKGGASLHQAQAMARHTDPKTTQIYFHNLERIKAGAEHFIQF